MDPQDLVRIAEAAAAGLTVPQDSEAQTEVHREVANLPTLLAQGELLPMVAAVLRLLDLNEFANVSVPYAQIAGHLRDAGYTWTAEELAATRMITVAVDGSDEFCRAVLKQAQLDFERGIPIHQRFAATIRAQLPELKRRGGN